MLRDDEILQNLPVGTVATMYFKDLGPQLGWTTVREATLYYFGILGGPQSIILNTKTRGMENLSRTILGFFFINTVHLSFS